MLSIDQSSTNLVDIGTSLGRRFDVRNIPLLGSALSLFKGHLAFGVEVRLVADQNKRNVILTLHSQYVFPVSAADKHENRSFIAAAADVHATRCLYI